MDTDIEMGNRLIKVGLNISYYRKLKSLTQEQLAEKSGLSRVEIGHIEAPNMFTNPTIATIFSIANALNIPASKLMELRDEDS